MKLNEEEIDKLVKEVSGEIKKTAEDILNEKKKDQIIKNETRKEEVNLGQLGNFKKVTKEEAQVVFEHLPETLFQIHKCLFKISYIQEGKFKFTAELINLEDQSK